MEPGRPSAGEPPATTGHDAGDAAAFIVSIDPATMRDARHVRAISAARDHADPHELTRAVMDARRAGDSWVIIAMALRITEDQARRRYGHVDADTRAYPPD